MALGGAGTTVVMMRGSDSRIDARVVVGDDVGAEIVSRETFWCWRAVRTWGSGLGDLSRYRCWGGVSLDCRSPDWLSVDCGVLD